ncbi:hypothetical protein GBF38_005146 [Nibea albiflora]|uniref:Uncharacterized protein n=1 Tax=Nibea albiflora TaxID=240163 RepID=A0ACB7EWG5_NIBAL|nr:hypothetical protein GBF38_005146 [Nibea albiflora]
MNSTMNTTEPTAATLKAESRKQIRQFVFLLTTRLLHKCDTLQSRTREQWVAHLKTLVSQTMEGLPVTSSFSADGKDVKKVCKAVQKDLQKKYGSKGLVQAAILQEDAATDAVIVQCLQTHTRAFITEHVIQRSCPRRRLTVADICLLAVGTVLVLGLLTLWVIFVTL